jgi:hypothetical protein
LERPHTLLLGNSRVLEGMPIPTGLRDGTSNIAMAGATMDELAALVALALKPGSPRHLVWGVDFSAFSAHYRGFRDAETERRLRGDAWLRARETALSFDALSASARTLVRAAGGRARLPPEERAPVPWQPEAVAAALAGLGDPTVPDLDQPTRVQITHWLEFYRHCALAPERVALFAHTVATIRAAGIELHAFLPPLSPYELEIIRQAGAWPAFLEWKRAVAGVTSYWDFSGYEAGANEYPSLFDRPYFSHFRPALGHVVLRHVLGDSCGTCGPLAARIIAAARHIESATVDAHLAAQDAARTAFVRGQSAYTERVQGIWEQTFAVQAPADSGNRRTSELEGEPPGEP